MKKDYFMQKLTKKLHDNNINDIEEILNEYENHFTYKLDDGYSEEEISRKLGNPITLADQYIESNVAINSGNAIITITGLIFVDIFIYSLFLSFIAWIIVLFAFSISSLTIGLSLFITINPFNLIPYLPYWCGAVLGVSFVSSAILSFVGTYYSYLYLIQIFKSYNRFHKNTIAKSMNKPTLPPIANHPVLSKKAARRFRSILLLSLNSFAISFVIGYLVCAITAGSFEFWHVFEWFV